MYTKFTEVEDRSWLSNQRIDGIVEKLDEKGETYGECQEQVHELPEASLEPSQKYTMELFLQKELMAFSR